MKACLQVSYRDDSVESLLSSHYDDILGVFEFSEAPPQNHSDPRRVYIPLPHLGPVQSELWRVASPVVSGQHGIINFNSCADLTLAHLRIELSTDSRIDIATREAYQQILAFLAQHKHPWPLKIWHYLPDITNGKNDDEQYRLFCAGRAYASTDNPIIMTAIPAATAVGSGSAQTHLSIYFLAGPESGQMVENPRQIPAPQYPRQYGIRSPLFSRGTLIASGQTHQFLISGTASILGHESMHDEDVRAQTREALRNLTALISQGRRLAPVNHSKRQKFVRAGGVLRVYVKQPKDIDLIKSELSKHPLGKLPTMFLRGDICREELLLEIDGIF